MQNAQDALNELILNGHFSIPMGNFKLEIVVDDYLESRQHHFRTFIYCPNDGEDISNANKGLALLKRNQIKEFLEKRISKEYNILLMDDGVSIDFYDKAPRNTEEKKDRISWVFKEIHTVASFIDEYEQGRSKFGMGL